MGSTSKSNISIVSQFCWGGLTSHRLNLKFNSPFVNLWIAENEYIHLAECFDEYIDEPLRFLKCEYEKTRHHYYPVAMLGDIKVNFNHSRSWERSVCEWNRRKERINKERLFFMFRSNSEENVERIKKIAIKKILFTRTNCESDYNTTVIRMPDEGDMDQMINSYPGEYNEPYNPISILLK